MSTYLLHLSVLHLCPTVSTLCVHFSLCAYLCFVRWSLHFCVFSWISKCWVICLLAVFWTLDCLRVLQHLLLPLWILHVWITGLDPQLHMTYQAEFWAQQAHDDLIVNENCRRIHKWNGITYICNSHHGGTMFATNIPLNNARRVASKLWPHRDTDFLGRCFEAAWWCSSFFPYQIWVTLCGHAT